MMPDWKTLLNDRLAGLEVHPARAMEIIEEVAADLEDKYTRRVGRGEDPVIVQAALLAELGAPGEFEKRVLAEVGHHTPKRPEQEFGGPGKVLENLGQDLRYGFRMLRKSPWFTVVAALTLALGIGASTAVFSAVYGVLWKPLPFPEPDRLVFFWGTFSGGNSAATSPPDFLDYRTQTKTFASLEASLGHSGRVPTTLTGSGEPARLRSSIVSAGYFDMLGIRPILGRNFSPAEERDGGHGVVILSHSLWQQRFGGDTGILGRSVILDRKPAQIVGVMPPGFSFPEGAELWRPIPFGSSDTTVRRFHFLRPIGRLKPGVTLEQAQAEMDILAEQLEKAYPESNTTWRLRLQPLLEYFVGDFRTPMRVLLGAVLLVLLIACVNVANLMLVRGTARHREMAIRLSLGASPARIASQLLAESGLLAVAAGLGGFALAWGATRWLQSLGPGFVPRQAEIQLESWMLAFSLGCSVLTGLLFGLAPVVQALRGRRGSEVLRDGGRSGASAGMQRLRGLLVVTEFALSLMLLVGAGLLVRTFWNLANVNLGFASENLLTTNLRLDEETYSDDGSKQRFYRALFEKLNAIPGVSAAAGTTVAPLRGFNDMYFTIAGRPPLPEGQKQAAQNRAVTAGYFEALGIRTLAGRVFGPGDRKGSPDVAIVNEAFAKTYLNGENVVGRKLTIDGEPPRTAEIVGVVSGARQRTNQDPFPEMYAPVEQLPAGTLDILLRTRGVPATSIAPAVRAAVQELDSTQTPGEFRTMEDVVDGTISRQRFTATLMLGFAVVALVLAGVGISGVLSHTVALRQQEIGVRMALGAGVSSVVRLVLRQGMGMALLGTGLGLAGAFALARTLQTMLFGIQPHDAGTFTAVCLFLLMVAAVACLIPARRAARVDPIVTLRHD